MLRLIVDSAADLSSQRIVDLPLEILPTPILIDEKEYLDGENLTAAELTSMMGSGGHTIKTRHVKPVMYEDAFLPHAAKGDGVICLCSSTGISGNYESAKIAAISVKEKYPDFDITVLDSKCASCGYGLVALHLARLIKKGKTKEEILKKAEEYTKQMRHLFTVSVMNYFMMGGRIARVLGNFGNTLNVRPIMTLNEDGAMQLVKPMQGTEHAMNAMLDMMKQDGADLSGQTVAFCYGDDRASLDYLIAKVKELFHPKDILISQVGCAITTHTGGSIIGVCYLK